MKKTLLLSLLTSALLSAASTTTADSSFIQLYADKDNKSNLIATVSSDKGTLIKKRCLTNRKSKRWCRVDYVYKDLTLHGYVQEEALQVFNTAPKNKKTFEQTFGGRYDDVASSVIATEGGYLLAGYTDSFGHGRSDAYVIKIDQFGNKRFSLALGGDLEDVASKVVETNDAYVLAGHTKSFGNGVESLYMAKISKSGELSWQKGFYSDKDDYYRAYDMVQISPRNFLLAGFENHVKFFNSETNIYLNAINSDGVRNGIKRYGGSKADEANSIINVSDGYVVAGYTKSWGHGGKDAYVIKLDKDGNRVWHNAFGFSYDEVANQIIQTQDGGYILVGMTDSDIRNQKEVYVVKMNANGQKEWQGHYGSREDEEGFGIVEESDGYVIAGYTKNTKSYSSDAYILKLSKNGNVMWERKYGLDKDDAFKSIIKTEDGFMLVGYETSLESYSKDAYIVKTDKNGKL